MKIANCDCSKELAKSKIDNDSKNMLFKFGDFSIRN